MMPALKARAPGCMVKAIDDKLSYRGWLAYYTFFFTEFFPGPSTFGVAFPHALGILREGRTRLAP
jgi:hypothetical protein